MKATIDFEPALYRRLKMEAARRGRTIRDLVTDGVRHVLGAPAPSEDTRPGERPAAWFGVLKAYASNAGAKHDLAAMRRSIARGRKGAP